MIKPLDQLTDELEESLNNYSATRQNILDGSFLFAKICPTCHKLITDRTSLYMMAKEGECPGCSHCRYD